MTALLTPASDQHSTHRHGIDLIQEITDGFANRVIRRKARQLVGKARLTPSDRDDLEQQLRIELLKRFRHFDPNRSHWQAFVLALVDRRVATILKKLRRPKHKHHEKLVSLSVLVPGEEGIPTELGETLLPRHQDFMVATSLHDDQTACALVADLQTTLRLLPEDLQKLCELRRTKTVSQIAQELQLPRSSVDYQFRKIAEFFQKHGLEKYLTSDL